MNLPPFLRMASANTKHERGVKERIHARTAGASATRTARERSRGPGEGDAIRPA